MNAAERATRQQKALEIIGKTFRGIDGELFAAQRVKLIETIDFLEKDYPASKEDEIEALQGLQNLLDSIADIASDIYGIPCLLTEGGD